MVVGSDVMRKRFIRLVMRDIPAWKRQATARFVFGTPHLKDTALANAHNAWMPLAQLIN